MPLDKTQILKNSLPVAIAYIVLGFTFGALFTSKGGTFFETIFIAIFCFAGAAQFVALEFYNPGTSFLFLFLTIFILNIRHVFYGLSFLKLSTGFSRIYLFSSLTDENYGLSNFYKSFNPTNKQWVMIFALNHLYWVIGCCLGCIVSKKNIIHFSGVDFILIALFISIFASSQKRKRLV